MVGDGWFGPMEGGEVLIRQEGGGVDDGSQVCGERDMTWHATEI